MGDQVQATTTMEKIVSLAKRRGFIFQSSEIYGGLNSCWDYGPLGVELKNNVKRAWWKAVVQMRDDMVGLDSSILMHPGSGRPVAMWLGLVIRWLTVNSAGNAFAPTTWKGTVVPSVAAN